jgi:hypothetical protein
VHGEVAFDAVRGELGIGEQADGVRGADQLAEVTEAATLQKRQSTGPVRGR